ncbi:MAG: shikimate dehydrogenase (NADP(+)) [Candidatus Binatia bacterium]|nr:MAG: shikimate dehydrogenase (NADP(+)) [Candidatus Binatia bacterium]
MRRSSVAVTGRTRVVGLLGFPVEHSRSPEMHNAAFRALGLDFVYVPFRVPPPRLREAFRGLLAAGVTGFNVTIPHKERVARLVDGLTPEARWCGAVNTVYVSRGRVIGHNTDVEGFLRSLPRNLRPDAAVVVGAGGAARAVVAGLWKLGVRDLRVLNRTRSRLEKLRRHFRRLGVRLGTGDLSSLRDESLLGRTSLLVNATSLGVRHERFPPFSPAKTPLDCLFYDVNYTGETDFLRRARLEGRETKGGLDMLLFQGAAAFRLWTGREAPVTVMARALRD